MVKNKRFLFLLSHQPNPRFIKQINFFAEKNEVDLLFFNRSNNLPDLSESINKSVSIINLGSILNLNVKPNIRDYIERFLIYLKALNVIRVNVKKSKYDIVIMNNIDVLILFIIGSLTSSYKNKIITIEISDLQEFVFYETTLSRIVRKIEIFLYRRYINKLILTSEKYYTYHFSKFYHKDYFILENKILSSEIFDPKSKKVLPKENQSKPSEKVIIGIVGCLLRKNEYIQLFEIYKNNENVLIYIYGKGPYQEIIENYSNKYPNIKYFGGYNSFLDSHSIYHQIDILYIVYDSELISKNNNLALPNKLYEAMYFNTPIICSSNTYLCEIVDELGIGVGIQYKNKGEIESAVNRIIQNKNSLDENFQKISKHRFIADDDYNKLSIFLEA